MGFAEYYVNICEAFGCGGHIYYFQTNCRGGPRLIYYCWMLSNCHFTSIIFVLFFKLKLSTCTDSLNLVLQPLFLKLPANKRAEREYYYIVSTAV